MITFLWVCVGGAAGVGVSRLISSLVRPGAPGASFPHGALALSLAGSLALGVALHFLLASGAVPQGVRIPLATGSLGGFITHASFNARAGRYLREAGWILGLWNIAATSAGCLAAGMLGLLGARRLFGG